MHSLVYTLWGFFLEYGNSEDTGLKINGQWIYFFIIWSITHCLHSMLQLTFTIILWRKDIMTSIVEIRKLRLRGISWAIPSFQVSKQKSLDFNQRLLDFLVCVFSTWLHHFASTVVFPDYASHSWKFPIEALSYTPLAHLLEVIFYT